MLPDFGTGEDGVKETIDKDSLCKSNKMLEMLE